MSVNRKGVVLGGDGLQGWAGYIDEDTVERS